MRRGLIWAPALGLVLVVVGCNPPAPIAYSPRGDRLAYFAHNQLRVRGASGESVVSYRPVTDIAWSDDGAKLAYATDTPEAKEADGKVVPKQTSVWIYDFSKNETAQADELTSPLCWFRGDLLATDTRGKKNRVATIDVGSGQVRFEAEAPQAIGSLLPSPATGDILATTSTVAYIFDGQEFRKGPPCPGDPLPTLGGQPILWDAEPLVDSKMMPIARHYNFYTWDGSSFKPFPTPTVPAHIDGDRKTVIISLPAAISPEGDRYVAITFAVKGTATQNSEVESLLRRLEKHQTKVDSDRLNNLGSKMKEFIALLSWTAGAGWQVVREEAQTNKGKAPNSVPLLTSIALKPDGSTIAWVDSGDKLQTIRLP